MSIEEDLRSLARILKTLKWILGGLSTMIVIAFTIGQSVSATLYQQKIVVEKQAAINSELLQRMNNGDHIDMEMRDELKNNKAVIATHEARIGALETDMRDVRNRQYGVAH